MSQAVVGGLRWVKGEIRLTLGRVTGLVEAYGQGGGPAVLGDAADALHEVRGVLLALALELPARLLEEMEQLCDAAAHQALAAPAAAEALLLALMRLPAYLDHLEAGSGAPDAALWATIDDLRAARGVPPLESAAGAGAAASPVPPAAELEALAAVLRQARPLFHRALLEWYRPVSGSDGLTHLGQLFNQVQGQLGAGPVADLFRLAVAQVSALRAGTLPADAAARALLGQLDRVFKPMATVPPKWPGTEVRQLVEVFLGGLAAAGVAAALVAELGPRYGGGAGAPLIGTEDALAGLAAAVLSELSGLKAGFDAFVCGPRDDLSPLGAFANDLEALARTLEVAEAGRLPERLRGLGDAIRGLTQADLERGGPGLESLAAELLAIEAALGASAERRGAPLLDLGALGFDADELVSATLREVCTEFVSVKDAITACQAEGARPAAFAGVPARLTSVAGALQVLGQAAPARVCEQLGGLIERAYLGRGRWPQGDEFDALAEAVAALELHSERVCEGQPQDPELIRRGGEAVGVLAHLLGVALSPEPAVPARVPSPAPPGPVAAPAQAAPAVSAEFIEIFQEEAEEELAVIAEHWARWRADPADEEALTRLRRSFHTLKGSGRMVGALRVGDLAWAAENLCNHLLDASLRADAGVLAWLHEVVAQMPAVVAADATGAAADITDLTARAAGLGRFDAGDTAAVPAAPMDTDAAVPGLTDDIGLFAADAALLGIFRTETLHHLEDVRDFLAHATLIPTVPGAETVRALHTLSGSAHMAGVDSIARVAKALERRLAAVAESGATLEIELLSPLRRAVEGIAGRIAELPGAGPAAGGLLALAGELERPPGGDAAGPPVSATPESGVDSLGSFAGEAAEAERFDDPEAALVRLELPDLLPPEVAGSVVPAAADDLGALPPLMLTGLESHAGDEAVLSLGMELEQVGAFPTLMSVAGAAPSEASGVLDLSLGEPDAAGLGELPPLDLAPPDLLSPDLPPLDLPPLDLPPLDLSPLDLPPLDLPPLAAAPAVPATLPEPVVERAEAPLGDLPGLTPPEVASPAASAGPPALAGAAGAPVVEPAAALPVDCDPCPDDQGMVGVFLEEAQDLLDGLDARLRAWQLAPRDTDQLDAINRLLHTLKGGARLTGVRGIGDLSHALESRLTGIANAGGRVDDTTLELAQQAFDTLSRQFDALEQRAPIPRAADLVAALSAPHPSAPAPEAPDLAVLTPAPVAATPLPPAPLVEPESLAEWLAEALPEVPAEVPAEALAEASTEASTEALPELPYEELPAFLREVTAPGAVPAAGPVVAVPQVRVRSDVIDHLVDSAGEVGLYRARLSQRNGLLGFSLGELDQTVRRLREQLRLLEMETEAQILFRFDREAEIGGEGPVFDPLELDRFSTLQQLSRSLAETVNDLASLGDVLGGYQRESADLLTQQARLADDLQDGLLRTRMVPFVQIVPRLHRLVRQTADDLGKSAQLTVIGPEVELDRVILNRLVAPLEHLLRNAVDHGLESAAVRVAAGKPATGRLTLELSREGSEVVIRLADDGRGLDLAAIRAQARARGLLAPQADPDDDALTQFVFEPGFTTQSAVTQISGRGVGLDVVASEIKAANGSLDLQSSAGHGVTFTLRLPLTLAIVRALLVGVGGSVYALPYAVLEAAARIGREDLEAIYAGQVHGEVRDFEYRGQAYRIADLGGLLDPRLPPDPGESRWAPLVLVRFGDQRVALHVDSLLGSTRILVKPLAARLGSLRWLAGGTILPDGRVALILDLPALLRGGLRQEHWAARAEPAVPKPALPAAGACVMVVDDSLTVRRVTTRMLEHRQIEVMTAKDGVEALTLLDERLPDLILLDVEMPRMDGYELLRHIRQSERLRGLPIIMITSRTGAKHRDHALVLGVDRFLGKPYQESELLAEIGSVLAERRP